MNIIWPCDSCERGTKHPQNIGINLENQIFCRSCYENILEDINCDSKKRTFCQNMKCKKCYYKSFASFERISNLDISAFRLMELKTPRLTSKRTYKKYPFICDLGHRWNVGPNRLAEGCWCPNLKCRKMRTTQTCMEKYGTAHPMQTEEIKKKMKKTCVEKYGVEYPIQTDEIKEKMQQTSMKKYGVRHHIQADKVKRKIRQTCMERYGVENSSQSEESKKKLRQTCLEKYGVENPAQSNEIRKKMKKTCLEKYGVENPMQSSEIRKKSRRTCMEKYGVEYSLQSQELKEKSRRTCMKKYGVEFSVQSEEFKEKIKKTCMEKYGVEHHLQCPEILAKNQKSAHSRKEYLFPSGRKIQVQGYEHIALNSLLHTYTEDDIQTSFENRLTIQYYINDKKHAYFPDIFIPSENLIIEVKSTYTYDVQKDKNELKAQACIDKGYKFQFYIIDRGGSIDIQTRHK